MPDISTEVAIATTTLASPAGSITFSSIPGTYTDLRLVLVHLGNITANGSNPYLWINVDSGTNYSQTYIQGNGTTALSSRAPNNPQIDFNGSSSSTSIPVMTTIDFFSYSGSTNKTLLYTSSADKNGSGVVTRAVGLWRNTSAITTIQLIMPTGSFAAGTTATLYGIL